MSITWLAGGGVLQCLSTWWWIWCDNHFFTFVICWCCAGLLDTARLSTIICTPVTLIDWLTNSQQWSTEQAHYITSHYTFSVHLQNNVMPLSSLHFPLLSRPVASLCLAI